MSLITLIISEISSFSDLSTSDLNDLAEFIIDLYKSSNNNYNEFKLKLIEMEINYHESIYKKLFNLCNKHIVNEVIKEESKPINYIAMPNTKPLDNDDAISVLPQYKRSYRSRSKSRSPSKYKHRHSKSRSPKKSYHLYFLYI